MEISGPDNSEERIASLERKIRDMEALAKGLVDETLGLKSGIISMSRDAEESSRLERRRGIAVMDTTSAASAAASASPAAAAPSYGTTVVRPMSARQPDAAAAPAEPEMVRIMQSDGTMKMEPRCGDRHQTDSSGGYGPGQSARLTRAIKKA